MLFIWAWSIAIAKVPFVSVSSAVLKNIEENLDIKDGSIVYDLGCGDGKVLFFLAKKYINVKFIGIENSLFPYMMASFSNFWFKKRYQDNVLIIKKDFFDVNLSKATHIFTYLFPNIMDDLLSKFNNELNSGTRLVSVSFKFTLKKESKEIDLNRSKYKLSRKIYVYEF